MRPIESITTVLPRISWAETLVALCGATPIRGNYFKRFARFLSTSFKRLDGKSIEDDSPYFDKTVEWKYRDPRFDGTFFTIMDEITTTSGVTMNWKPEWLVNGDTGYDIQKRGVYYGDNNWNRRVDTP